MAMVFMMVVVCHGVHDGGGGHSFRDGGVVVLMVVVVVVVVTAALMFHAWPSLCRHKPNPLVFSQEM